VARRVVLGLSRAIDYFETDKERGTPNAWALKDIRAGARKRFWLRPWTSAGPSFTPVAPGEGGAKLHRHDMGESVDRRWRSGEYHWMAGKVSSNSAGH